MKKIFIAAVTILAFSLVGCNKHDDNIIPDTTRPSLGTPEDNEIWFTLADNRGLFAMEQTAFNSAIEEIIYSEESISVIRFVEPLTTIGADAFNGCTNLQNISLPNSVESVSERAFFNCTNLEAITLGARLRNCGAKAFNNCINLYSLHISSIMDWCKITFTDKTSNPAYYSQALLVDGEKITKINIPNGLASLSAYAFCGNIYVDTVAIPSSLQSIGVGAFEECTNLRRVEISDISKWSAIEFGNETANPLSITQELYLNGGLVTSVNIVGIEKVSAYAFINCTSIREFSSDNSLLSIGDNAFRNCTSLATAELGSGIKEIGAQGFMNCSALQLVTLNAANPPLLANDDVFSFNSKERKFAVPATSLDAYANDTMWSQYKDFLTAIE